nr:hypothetical protein Iba_chr04fCG4510 [Ipomoea batatas]
MVIRISTLKKSYQATATVPPLYCDLSAETVIYSENDELFHLKLFRCSFDTWLQPYIPAADINFGSNCQRIASLSDNFLASCYLIPRAYGLFNLSVAVLLILLCLASSTVAVSYSAILEGMHMDMITSAEPPMKRRFGLWIVQAGRGSYRGS